MKENYIIVFKYTKNDIGHEEMFSDLLFTNKEIATNVLQTINSFAVKAFNFLKNINFEKYHLFKVYPSPMGFSVLYDEDSNLLFSVEIKRLFEF